MTCPLRIEVRDQLHRVLREFEEDSEWLRFCHKAKALGVRYVDFIFEYQDAMLNSFQMLAWFEDFPKVLDSDVFKASERESAERVLQAAREAEEVAGYLFIEA